MGALSCDEAPLIKEENKVKMIEKIYAAKASIEKRTDFKPRVALVLGSGLGAFAEQNMEVCASIDYSDIDSFPVSTVAGHTGRLIFGYVGNVPVAAMQGRVHYYEGNAVEDTALPIRTLRLLGCEKLILTNAAGGINTEYAVGDFMMLTDHIASLIPSPLRGENLDGLGVRFPDMTRVYDADFCEAARNIARENNIKMHEGVYIQTPGPQYETPAEIKMYRAWGADAVGMSTACEAIAARHAGYKIFGVSLITNAAAGLNKKDLTHEEVKEAADTAAEKFACLVSELIKKIG